MHPFTNEYRSVNASVSLEQTLQVLNCRVTSKAMPVRTFCPVCREAKLVIHEDSLSGGHWYHCIKCASSGDLVELCARVWECSPAVTVRRMQEQGLLLHAEKLSAEAIQQYLAHHPQMRTKMQDFWKESRDYFPHVRSAQINYLLNCFKLLSTLPEDRWKLGAGRLIGAMTPDGLERAFCDLPGRHGKVLRGRGWREVLVAPFYDLPERICGFLFLGRDGQPQDRIFKPQPILQMSRGLAEGGLAGLWTIEASRAFLGEHVIAVADPFFAARLQYQHFRAANIPLPIVAWQDSANALTCLVWKSVQRIPIFWGWRMTPSLLNQAVMTDGMISIMSVEDLSVKSINHYLRLYTSTELAQRVVKRAKPWREFLVNWAENMPAGEIEELLLSLECYRHDVQAIASLSPKLAAALRIVNAPKRVTLNGIAIVEKNGQWWCADPRKGTSLLFNAVLRVTEEFVKGETLTYRMSVIRDGEGTPLECPAKGAFCRAFSQQLKASVLKNTGRQLYIHPAWKTKLTDIALLFHTPEAGETEFLRTHQWPTQAF